MFDGMRVVLLYQPVQGTDVEGMNEYRSAPENRIAMSSRDRLSIGGDFNDNVGRGNTRRGVCGNYSASRMNEAGRDLIVWCEENGLAYVNSFMKHARRGTWSLAISSLVTSSLFLTTSPFFHHTVLFSPHRP